MTHYNIVIQLPKYYNSVPGKKERVEIEPKKFHDTYLELLDMIGGVNTSDTVIKGAWHNSKDNQNYFDDNIAFNLLVEAGGNEDIMDVPKIKQLMAYKEKLKERFEQKEIFMVATRCYWL